ncbi:MAG: hypothetical protein ABJB11_03990 [Ferruginibacter sp.]
MQFQQIINSKISKESDRPLMQKDAYAVSEHLQLYLHNNGRLQVFPIDYNSLLHYSHANSQRDKSGKLTHWENAVYDEAAQFFLDKSLVKTFAILKNNNTPQFINNLLVKRIDFCEFGNSIPFRVEIEYQDSGLSDRFYIKMADASRIYGLELEQLLSPNKTNFIYNNNTLVEEHIEGIPGDVFLKNQLPTIKSSIASLAKEFVQFNERCFARLLGDMRSYNFVIDESASNGESQYRIRALDFDQQSYEGRKNLYMPQFYKENFVFIEMVLKTLSNEEIARYQQEERASIRSRAKQSHRRLFELLNSMDKEELSENYKVLILRKELNEHFNTVAFSRCKTMGALVKRQLKQVLSQDLAAIKV